MKISEITNLKVNSFLAFYFWSYEFIFWYLH